MRQPLLTLIMVALALVTGYELRGMKQGEPAGDAGPAYVPAPGEGARAGRAAETGPDEHAERERRLAKQRKTVLELQSKLERKRAELSALEEKRQPPPPSTDAMAANQDAELAAARAALHALAQERAGLGRRTEKSQVDREVVDAGRKLSRELAVAQAQEQLKREQAIAAELDRRYREAASINIDTDAYRQLAPLAEAQARKVRELQARARALRFETAAEDAEDRAARRSAAAHGEVAASLSALDERIRRQEAAVSRLEQARDAGRERQAAGEAAREGLGERYLELKREHDEMASELGEQQRILASLSAS